MKLTGTHYRTNTKCAISIRNNKITVSEGDGKYNITWNGEKPELFHRVDNSGQKNNLAQFIGKNLFYDFNNSSHIECVEIQYWNMGEVFIHIDYGKRPFPRADIRFASETIIFVLDDVSKFLFRKFILETFGNNGII